MKLISNFLGQCRADAKKPLLVLLGPTASGKTSIALKIAHYSRQVYRHMDIGTDKIMPEKREGIPHYLIDVVEPPRRFTVADFKRLAEAAIDDILSRGKLPMLVGGTGLYIRSVTQNFAIPPENPKLRGELMNELAEFGAEHMHKKLQNLDPANAAKIHPNNIPYVIRALEILLSTGKPKNAQKNAPKYACLQIGLDWPREKLFERINARVDEQIERGLIEEAKRLLNMGFAPDLPAMNTLGYKEMVAHLQGGLTLEAALELLKKNTRNYAKRQMTWFKRDEGIVWMKMSS